MALGLAATGIGICLFYDILFSKHLRILCLVPVDAGNNMASSGQQKLGVGWLIPSMDSELFSFRRKL